MNVIKIIMAILRTVCLRKIVEELEQIKIREMTISEAKGIGEQVTLYEPYAIHNMIQIIVPDEKVDEVQDVILNCTSTGMAGDGIIAVSPVDYIIKIKTKERLE